MRLMKLLISIGLIALAALIHVHHVDYDSAESSKLLLALGPARGDWVDEDGRRYKSALLTVDDSSIVRLIEPENELPSKAAQAAADAAFAAARAAAVAAADGKRNVGTDAEAQSLRAREVRLHAELKRHAHFLREQDLAKLAKRRGKYGLLPSSQLRGTEEDQRQQAFWIGLIVPFTLIFLAAVVFLLPTRLSRSAGRHVQPIEPRLDTAKPTPFRVNSENGPAVASPMSLADSLRAEYGEEIPVASGNATEEDPLVITAVRDYVSVEYAALRHACISSDQEFRRTSQSLLNRDGRYLDRLSVELRPTGAEEWSEQRDFYFDITIGYRAI